MRKKIDDMETQLAQKEMQLDSLQKAPIINELCQLTGKDSKFFVDMSKADLEVALGAARLASTRRKGISTRENKNGFDDLSKTVDAYEVDEETGIIKHVFARAGSDKAIW